MPEEKKPAAELDDAVHAEAAAHNAHVALSRASLALTEAYGIRLVLKERENQALRRDLAVLQLRLTERELENRALTESLATTLEIVNGPPKVDPGASSAEETAVPSPEAVPESPTRVGDRPTAKKRRRPRRRR